MVAERFFESLTDFLLAKEAELQRVMLATGADVVGEEVVLSDLVSLLASRGVFLEFVEASLVEGVGVPRGVGEEPIERGLVGGLSELAVDPENCLSLGDHQPSEIFGRYSSGISNGWVVCLVLQEWFSYSKLIRLPVLLVRSEQIEGKMETFSLRVAVSSLAIAAVLAGYAREELDLFSVYKKTESFQGFINWQQSSLEINNEQMLKISFFPKGVDWQAGQFMVDKAGQSYSRSVAHGSAAGDGKLNQLTREEISKLKAECSKLAASTLHPPLKHLVCVSYKDPLNSSKWITKTYDIQIAHESIDRLFELAHFKDNSQYKSYKRSLNLIK